MRVVVNTSPLIVLDRIGHLEILKALYGSIIRPQSVLDELNVGRGRYELSSDLCDAEWIITEPDPVVTLHMTPLSTPSMSKPEKTKQLNR
jgi:predicted nucleic acid-binding protein